jgi:hypothetical protein
VERHRPAGHRGATRTAHGAQTSRTGLTPPANPADARAYLKRWCTSAKRSRIPAFVNLVRRIEKHFDAIIAAVELGLSNFRLEGINAKIRLIQRRGYGFRNLDALTAAIYLCLGGITLSLPTEGSVVAQVLDSIKLRRARVRGRTSGGSP